jgi:hypothetical protein
MTRRLPVLALLFITSTAAHSLFNSAFAAADELSPFTVRPEFRDLDAPPLDPDETLEVPLPTRMKLQDEAELKKIHDERRYSFDTPRQAPAERPLIDWERIEPGIFTGLVYYGSGFRADPEALLGVSLRLPIPGLPTSRFAAFAEFFGSYVNRDLPFFYSNQAGTWYGATVGGNYTLYDGPYAYVRARGGIIYADFNGVRELKNGMGILVGGELGFYWVQHTDRFRVTIIPEYTFSGKDSMILLTLGLSFYF